MAIPVGRHMNTGVDTLCICSHCSEARSLQLPFPSPLSSSTLPRSFLLPVLCGAITARTWLPPPICSALPISSLLLLAADRVRTSGGHAGLPCPPRPLVLAAEPAESASRTVVLHLQRRMENLELLLLCKLQLPSQDGRPEPHTVSKTSARCGGVDECLGHGPTTLGVVAPQSWPGFERTAAAAA